MTNPISFELTTNGVAAVPSVTYATQALADAAAAAARVSDPNKTIAVREKQ